MPLQFVSPSNDKPFFHEVWLSLVILFDPRAGYIFLLSPPVVVPPLCLIPVEILPDEIRHHTFM